MKAEAIRILRDIAKNITPREGVRVQVTQHGLWFTTGRLTKEAAQAILATKSEAAEYAVATYTHRTFKHTKNRGRKIWRWGYDLRSGQRCGIDLVLTKEENDAVILGDAGMSTKGI